MLDSIQIYGAKEHNLKNIDVTIPSKKLVVITGLSGSGKSTLAFDTIYAEGQRRYMETLSPYARQFIGNFERPDVDKITGLSPVIAIEQKSTIKNPRSTVGTITEIYDFLRLLFARIAEAYSYVTGEKMVKYTDEKILWLIQKKFKNEKIIILAPVVRARKGHYHELFEQIAKKGFIKVRVDGEIMNITYGMKLDRYKTHDIEIVVDQPPPPASGSGGSERLFNSIKIALTHGKGVMMILDIDDNSIHYFSRKLMCPTSGIAYDDPEPNLFSFNSPYGSCPKCKGLGYISSVDEKKIIPNPELSIKKGGLTPIGICKDSWIFNEIEKIGRKFEFTLDTPIKSLSTEAKEAILYGTDNFEGIINFLINWQEYTETLHKWAENFIENIPCPECNGTRLKKHALHFKVANKNIAELSEMSISALTNWFNNIESQLSEKQQKIARDILKELRTRLQLLLELGLGYLTLNREANTLSGGESQRLRLATQIGSKLVNVLYILDEPTIGCHQRDITRLINSLQQLVKIGNSVIVVEHDKKMITSADYVIDLGPAAGINGGNLIAYGTPKEFLKYDTLTTLYLKGVKEINIPAKRRNGNRKYIKLFGCKGNNLKSINATFPLGKMVCVTGVSGSGKTSLVTDTLEPILSQHFYNSLKKPLPYDRIEGIENIDKVIVIDQSPIGRTPRSNPATYTNVFTEIRKLFALLPEAKIRGYKPGRFSFNVKGGRCETCKGAGVIAIEMNFLPDVHVKCNTCQGKRYNRQTLEIRYKGKSISDVLEMTINEAVNLFENIPVIIQKIKTLQKVGLGYLTLGQPSTTLSGGEAQRVKLSAELSKKDTGKTLYILDEPTTGLHFEDIKILLDVLNELVDKGNTVVIIEHNLDVIKVADYIIDLGPEGGDEGGYIVCKGTPEEIVNCKKSHTGRFLRQEAGIRMTME